MQEVRRLVSKKPSRKRNIFSNNYIVVYSVESQKMAREVFVSDNVRPPAAYATAHGNERPPFPVWNCTSAGRPWPDSGRRFLQISFCWHGSLPAALCSLDLPSFGLLGVNQFLSLSRGCFPLTAGSLPAGLRLRGDPAGWLPVSSLQPDRDFVKYSNNTSLGSASTKSTWAPAWASPIPRLTVVVVFPTPPF